MITWERVIHVVELIEFTRRVLLVSDAGPPPPAALRARGPDQSDALREHEGRADPRLCAHPEDVQLVQPGAAREAPAHHTDTEHLPRQPDDAPRGGEVQTHPLRGQGLSGVRRRDRGGAQVLGAGRVPAEDAAQAANTDANTL